MSKTKSQRKFERARAERFEEVTGVPFSEENADLLLILDDMFTAGPANHLILALIWAGQRFFKPGLALSHVQVTDIITKLSDVVEEEQTRDLIEELYNDETLERPFTRYGEGQVLVMEDSL